MRYIQVGPDGKLIGHFANLQPGYAEVEVPDDHPLIKEWEDARKQKRSTVERREAIKQTILDRLIDAELIKERL